MSDKTSKKKNPTCCRVSKCISQIHAQYEYIIHHEFLLVCTLLNIDASCDPLTDQMIEHTGNFMHTNTFFDHWVTVYISTLMVSWEQKTQPLVLVTFVGGIKPCHYIFSHVS